MNKLIVGMLFCLSLFGQVTKHVVAAPGNCIGVPCSNDPINLPFDSVGSSCPTGVGITWGTCAGQEVAIQFDNVPVGYTVKLIRVYGDFIAWVHGKVPEGTNSGVLWGLYNSANNYSSTLQYASNGTYTYFQGAVNATNFRGSFDTTFVNATLPPNNVIINHNAIFLNDTGQSIHMESTFTLVYQFILQ